MPEENKKDNLIDVGDGDESATEINLDEQQPKKDAAKEEEKIEVEQVEAKPVEEKKEEKNFLNLINLMFRNLKTESKQIWTLQDKL